MTNPLAGHTAGVGFGVNAQGLRDGDGLTSASLTNIYEALHGNGIVRLEAGASGHALRRSIISSTPGFTEQGPSGTSYVKVYGGYCVLDSTMYSFANGITSSEEFQIGVSANYSGTLPSPPAAVSDVFVVVYLSGNVGTEKHLMYEVGTPVAVTVGTPLIPNAFLSNPSVNATTNLNHQTTIIAVMRYTMAAGQSTLQAALSASPVIHDRRTYVRTPPLYLTPLTKGVVGDVADSNNVDSAGAVDLRFASPEHGDLSGSTFGAIWQTHNEGDFVGDSNSHAVLLYAAPRDLHSTPSTKTHRLGPDQVVSMTASKSFTFDQANIFLVNTAGGAVTLTPNGTFPPGHIVKIRNNSPSGSNAVIFDDAKPTSSGASANQSIAVGKYSEFVYDGTNWFVLFAQA